MNASLSRFAAVLLLALAVSLSVACRSPLEGGAGARFVSASRAAHDLWADDLKAYYAADAKLDPLLRDQKTKSVDDWTLALEAAEEAVKPDMVGVPILPTSAPKVPR